MKKILIVEDDITIHNLISEILKNEQYSILNAYYGTEALMITENEKLDLILLDLMLPGLDGEEIIKRIKGIPIIVISAKTAIEDKVKVLLDGANDYITKPFASEELLARIKVQLRKNENINKELKYKELILNEEKQMMIVEDNAIHLTKTELAILKQLLLNPKQVVTKTKLLDSISSDMLYCDENSLKVHISNIRKKLKAVTDNDYIESVWGIGFKMYE